MSTSDLLPAAHPLSRFYRVAAGAFGLVLVAFGVIGLASGLPFLAVSAPPMMMGFGSNGLLSTISIVVGAVLTGVAARGGQSASTTMTVLGGLFLLSGLGNLAVLDSMVNVLAFRFPNVVFSLVAGMALLFTGLYGRVGGGLAADNPFVLARRGGPALDPATTRAALHDGEEMAAAEYAVGNGRATPEQARLVRADAERRATEHRRRTHAAARGAERPGPGGPG